MARSKRRASFRRRPFTPADWVYRPCLQDAAGAAIDDLGTYDQNVGLLTAGPANANFHVLYDSHNHLVQSKGPSLAGATALTMPMAARAEAMRPKIMRVQGVTLVRPTAWTVGSLTMVGFRFGIWEQDPQSGSILIDPAYSMWTGGGAGINQLRPATWANDRNWQVERRLMVAFGENSSGAWTMRWNFTVNRRLDPNEAYGVYMESDSTWATATNVQYKHFIRTLVADEG